MGSSRLQESRRPDRPVHRTLRYHAAPRPQSVRWVSAGPAATRGCRACATKEGTRAAWLRRRRNNLVGAARTPEREVSLPSSLVPSCQAANLRVVGPKMQASTRGGAGSAAPAFEELYGALMLLGRRPRAECPEIASLPGL